MASSHLWPLAGAPRVPQAVRARFPDGLPRQGVCMTETLYEIVFQGRLVEGFSVDQVKANISRLFQATPEQIERLFSGHRVVIRNQLDQVSALKYQALLRKQGALCQVIPMAAAQPEQAKPASQPAPARTEPAARAAPAPAAEPPQATRPAGRLRLAGERVDEILAGLSLDLAPPGARLSEPSPEPPPPPRVDHLTLAPLGERLSMAPEPPARLELSLDHLRLMPTDSDLPRS